MDEPMIEHNPRCDEPSHESTRSEVCDDRNWKRDFKDALEKHNEILDKQSNQIDKLLEGLKEEKEARKDEDRTLRSRLDKMSGFFAGANVVWLIGALVLGALLQWGVPKLFEQPAPIQPVPILFGLATVLSPR